VTWRAPRSKGVEIRVYGVTECLARPAHPEPDSRGPCLVKHTPLPASVRTLLATARASDGKVAGLKRKPCNLRADQRPTGRRTSQSCSPPTTRRATRSSPSRSLASGGSRSWRHDLLTLPAPHPGPC
jgi:hypothetical protein